MIPKFIRRYITYFDGLQEELYFNHVAKLIREKNPNLQVKFEKKKNIDGLAKSSTAMRKIAIYDYDMNKEEFKKRAQYSKSIDLYYSNISFDLWLLLHKMPYNMVVSSPHDYIKDVRKCYNLNSARSSKKIEDIKEEKNIKKVLEQITLEDVKYAIDNARNIMDNKLKGDVIVLNSKFKYYDNPATNLHEFFEKLFKEIEEETGIII